MIVVVDATSARFEVVKNLFGTWAVPVVDVDGEGATVDVERLDSMTRARLAGVGGRVVTFVIALGDDCKLYEHELF